MLALILAAQLVGLQPANDSVEIEVLAGGTAEVPADGYQITAMLRQDGGTLAAKLARLEAPKRDTCIPEARFGFVGNAAYEGDEEGQADEAEASAEAQPASGFQPPFFYSGRFASREKAEQALALIRSGNPAMTGAMPVLYECSDARMKAKLDALAHSAQDAARMADALGMQVVGVTRVADENDQTTMALEMAGLYSDRTFDRDTVAVRQRVKVTYLLRK